MKTFRTFSKILRSDRIERETCEYRPKLNLLEPADSLGSMTLYGRKNFRIARMDFDYALDRFITVKDNDVVFYILLASDGKSSLNHQEIKSGTLSVFNAGETLYLYSRGGYKAVTLSVSSKLINTLSMLYTKLDFDTLSEKRQTALIGTDTRKVLSDKLTELGRVYEKNHSTNDIDITCLSLEREIIEILLDSVLLGSPYPTRSKKRQLMLNSLVESINQSIPDYSSVREIYKEHGFTPRTVQYAFKDMYDMTPTAYLKKVKLNHIYRDLARNTAQQTTVSKVANHYGLWHMGVFAQDYKKLFRELPSETLQREPLLS